VPAYIVAFQKGVLSVKLSFGDVSELYWLNGVRCGVVTNGEQTMPLPVSPSLPCFVSIGCVLGRNRGKGYHF
jgi:hypothetical protein